MKVQRFALVCRREVKKMSKYYTCYFASFNELEAELKKVTKAEDARVIAGVCETHVCVRLTG